MILYTLALSLVALAAAQTNQVAVNPSQFGTSNGVFGTSNINTFGTSSGNQLITSASDLPFSRVGKCINANINTARANFGTITNERNGYWVYSAVPNTQEFKSLVWAHLHSQLTNTNGFYLVNIYSQVQNEELHRRAVLNVQDTQFGYSVASTGGNSNVFISFNIFITDYSQGRYAVFYICSDDVDDIGVDYRYVISHGWPLTNAERRTIYANDRSQPFRGSLVML